jgi:hypothetical protein
VVQQGRSRSNYKVAAGCFSRISIRFRGPAFLPHAQHPSLRNVRALCVRQSPMRIFWGRQRHEPPLIQRCCGKTVPMSPDGLHQVRHDWRRRSPRLEAARQQAARLKGHDPPAEFSADERPPPRPPSYPRNRGRRSFLARPARPAHVGSSSGSKRCVFESVHISTHIIYAMLTEKTFNSFVECSAGLVSGEGLSITFKFGRKRSIEHIQSLSEPIKLSKKISSHK